MLAHPEYRQDIDRGFEEEWQGRPDTRGLKSAVGRFFNILFLCCVLSWTSTKLPDIDSTCLESAVRERGADVETVEAVGQEKQKNDLFKKRI